MFSLHKLPNKKTGEETRIFLRRHWFVFFVALLVFAVFFAAPLVLFGIYRQLWPNLLESNVALALVVLLSSAYYLSIWLFLFHNFVDYYLDVWIVTNRRIINVEQKGIFARTISEMEMERVQDITSDVKGLFPTLLGYGDVEIQTAAAKKRFLFKQIPRPGSVAKKIARIVQDIQAEAARPGATRARTASATPGVPGQPMATGAAASRRKPPGYRF